MKARLLQIRPGWKQAKAMAFLVLRQKTHHLDPFPLTGPSTDTGADTDIWSVRIVSL